MRPFYPHRGGLLLGAACSFLLCACASEERSVETAYREDPLPFHAAIYLASATGIEEATSSAAPRRGVSFRAGASGLADELARSLESPPGVVSLATVVSAASLEEALDAARRENADYVLVLDFQTAEGYEDFERPLGWASLEILSWLFGGIPSWFVPTLHYVTNTTLEVRGVDPAAEGSVAPAWRETIRSRTQGASLWDRSDIWDRPLDYVTTVVVPPMLLASATPERLAGELTQSTVLDVAEKLRDSVRRRLSDIEAAAPLSVTFLTPPPARRLDANSFRARLAISSLDGSGVRAMDLIRLAEGSELFRWQASREDLQRLAEGLKTAGSSGAYFEYVVPSEIPLAYGENVIKVRLMREDGSVLTRTAVYRR